MKLSITLLSLLLAIVLLAEASYCHYVTLTYDLELKNNSALMIDISQGGKVLLARPWANEVFQYVGYAVNPKDKLYYFLGDYELITFNASALIISKHESLNDIPTEIQYNPVNGKLYGILQENDNEFIEINLSNVNQFTKIMTFDDDFAIIEGANTLDYKRNIYYVCVSDSNNNNLVVGYDLNNKQIAYTLNLTSNEIDGLAYDETTDQLVGFYTKNTGCSGNETCTWFCSIKNGKLEIWNNLDKPGALPGGILGLFSNSASYGMYFYQVDYFGKYTFGVIDLVRRRLMTSFPIYNNFIYGHYFH